MTPKLAKSIAALLRDVDSIAASRKLAAPSPAAAAARARVEATIAPHLPAKE